MRSFRLKDISGEQAGQTNRIECEEFSQSNIKVILSPPRTAAFHVNVGKTQMMCRKVTRIS